MQPYFARFGISGAQWGVLRQLHLAEQEGLAGLRQTDLSERLLVRPPSVTGVVDRLERVGYVQRDSDLMPKQGANAPWKLRQNYILDLASSRFGDVTESLRFTRPGEPVRPVEPVA